MDCINLLHLANPRDANDSNLNTNRKVADESLSPISATCKLCYRSENVNYKEATFRKHGVTAKWALNGKNSLLISSFLIDWTRTQIRINAIRGKTYGVLSNDHLRLKFLRKPSTTEPCSKPQMLFCCSVSCKSHGKTSEKLLSLKSQFTAQLPENAPYCTANLKGFRHPIKKWCFKLICWL